MDSIKFHKIGIIGTGAVGGYFGAKLALAGIEVVFLTRGKNLAAMQKNGLILDSLGEKFIIKNATFTDDPSKLNDCDLFLFTVKSYDTQASINQIKAHIKPEAIFLTPQNGISNDQLLGATFGRDRVIPGFARIGVSMPEPGHIVHTSLGIIGLGEYGGSVSDRLKAIEELFTKASVEINLFQDIQSERWKKFIWNCTFNIICSITGQPVNVVLNHKPLYDLAIATMREIIQLAIKEGANFGDEDVIAARIDGAKKLGNFKTSMLEDLEKGKQIELDAFTGTVIKLAEKHKLDVPVNRTLYALLSGKILQTVNLQTN